MSQLQLPPDQRDFANGRPVFLLDVTPKEDNKYLINGRIWVDATDYSIVRIEGSPARNPSFWVRSVHFEHTYQKVGPFWLASSTHSVGEIRSFGEAELTIETSGYALKPPDVRTAKADYPAGLALLIWPQSTPVELGEFLLRTPRFR